MVFVPVLLLSKSIFTWFPFKILIGFKFSYHVLIWSHIDDLPVCGFPIHPYFLWKDRGPGAGEKAAQPDAAFRVSIPVYLIFRVLFVSFEHWDVRGDRK